MNNFNTPDLPEKKNQVFVNRTLNMSSIKLIGFDMDYTLIRYNVPEFEALAYEIMKQKMIKEYDYPEAIADFQFDKDFIIRGLAIDTESGDFLKINRYGFVRTASHGTKFYSYEEQREKFGNGSIDLSDSRYYIIHTLFSQAFGCLYAQLVDYFDEHNMRHLYKTAFADLHKCLNDAHQETELKGNVTEYPERYIYKSPAIAETLAKFKRFGKKIALITNSDYNYTNKVMKYSIEPFIKGKWQSLFDLVVTSSEKPGFFTGSARYLRVDEETGLLSNFYGAIEWGGIYQGGNAAILEKHLQLKPSEIIYFGDHIVGDVVTLKETIGWRTALVVQELAEEVPILSATAHLRKQIAEKMQQKEDLEERSLVCREAIWCNPRDPNSKPRQDLEKIKEEIAALDNEIRDLLSESQKDFNKYWGEVMRAGNEVSRFATLVERYACIYMSSIEDLAEYSPFKYFRSQRRFLPHDPVHY